MTGTRGRGRRHGHGEYCALPFACLWEVKHVTFVFPRRTLRSCWMWNRVKNRSMYIMGAVSPLDVENIGYVRNCDQPAYPAYGLDCPHEAAFAVRHSDGNLSTQLEVCAMEEKDTGEARTLSIRMKDKVYDFYVTLYYKAYRDVDIIEAWSSFRNEEKGEVVLGQFASAYLPVRRGDVWLSRLYGAWANEARWCKSLCVPVWRSSKTRMACAIPTPPMRK